jgi:F0F1-type ATP synthase membrane subunit c/vacuolar-type H+-ATPase subunit K
MSEEQKEPRPEKQQTLSMGYWMAIGAGVGVALHNIGMGVAIGIVLGAAIGAAQAQRNKNQ